jgi:hypothetical protein
MDRGAHALSVGWLAPGRAMMISAAILFACTVMVTAQEPAPAPEPGTNAPPRTATNAVPDVVTNVPPEPATTTAPEPPDRAPGEPAEATAAAATNAPANPGAPNARDTRTMPAVPGAKEDAAPRQTNATSRPRPAAPRERAPGTAAAGPAPVSFDSFKLVVDRNIFDPNRTRRGSFGSVRPPRAVDSFSLVGTMSYGKGTFAFFDGSSAEYRKALKTSGKIADYKLTEIADRRVKLASGTNIVEMTVGTQLRREEEGAWTFVAQAGSYSSGGGPDRSGGPGGPGRRPGGFGDFGGNQASSGSSAGTGTPDPDVLKRLMERRAKEMNP